ncbi:MAG: TetR/AcrR family transcriptional regulator [Candidatus Thorarchaeota archaeon]|nr:MAG: TetR/AcrR family transcriptional regulator [Candidatus Thorarchaeota archaeon]
MSKKFTRDKASKIEAIISAMDRLVSGRGYEGFSINDIPDEAGLSIGTVYRYFPKGKADILKEMMKRNIEALVDLVDLDLMNESNFKEKWKAIIKLHLELRRNGSLYGSSLRDTSTVSPELTEDIRPIIIGFYRMVAERLATLKMFRRTPMDEILIKLHLAFTVMSEVRETHLRIALFKDDAAYVEYLHHMVLYTFGIE